MTKEITKAWILQQLEDEFALRDWESERFLFSETVIPTFDIRSHVQKPTCDWEEKSITGGSAAEWFFAVPQNERWYLSRYNVVFMAAGAYKVTGVFIDRINEVSGSSFIYLDMTLGQTVSYANDLPNPVRLDPGDRILIYIDDFTSTAALRLYIDYIVEVIR